MVEKKLQIERDQLVGGGSARVLYGEGCKEKRDLLETNPITGRGRNGDRIRKGGRSREGGERKSTLGKVIAQKGKVGGRYPKKKWTR